MAKEYITGTKNILNHYKSICEVLEGDVSAEVISTDGLNLIAEIRHIYYNYGFGTEILAAFVRHIMHVIDCSKLGADVMTGPLSSIEGLLPHPLIDSGLSKS